MSKQHIGRLAMRKEGMWWNAYYAREETMTGAIHLGSIRINLAMNPEIKEAFLSTMKLAVGNAIEDLFGQEPGWEKPQDAPEAERSGHA